MGAYRAGEATRLVDFGFRQHGARDALWRIDLLQQNGIDHSGRGLAYAQSGYSHCGTREALCDRRARAVPRTP